MANELYRTYEVLIEETVPDGHEKREKDRTKKPLRWNEEVDGALRDTHMVFQDAVCYYTLLVAGLAGNEKVADGTAPEKQVLLNPLWGHLTGALNAETEKAIRRLTANYKLPSGVKTAQDFLEKIYTWPETKEKRSELRNLLPRVYLRLESAGIDKDKETGQPKKLKAMADFASNWIRPLNDPTTNQADSTQGLRNENYFAVRKLELKPENNLPPNDASLSSAIELKHCFMTSKGELAGEKALCDYLAAFGCESGGKKPTTIGKIEGDVLLAKNLLIAAWGEFPKTPKDATKEQKQSFKAKQVQWHEKAKTFPLKSWSGKKPNKLLWYCLRYKWAKNEVTRNALYEQIKNFKPHQLTDGQTDEINQWRNLLPKGCVPFPFFTTQLGSAAFLDFDFDKAALATAAEDVFKYKIRTLEREKKVWKLRNMIQAYKASGETPLDEELSPTGKPIKVRGMEGDARWKGEQQNENKGIEELLADMKRTKELDDYGLREGTIGGWAELRKRLVDVHQKGTKAGKGQSELCNDLEDAVDAEQTANRQGFGSADFFHKLCEPAYHHLWLPAAEHNGIKDFIPHYVAYSEWKEELRDLLEEQLANDNENDDNVIEENEPRTKPISYTWPGLLNRHGEPSYRYYDFKTKLNETLTFQKLFRRIRPAGGGAPSYALIEKQIVKIAARRLKRDKVMTLNGTSIDALWCPPLILQGNEQPSTKTQPRVGKSKNKKWPKGDIEVSFSLIARPFPKDPWNEVSGVPSELEIHPVHLKVSVPIEQEQQAKLFNGSLHWAKGSLKGFDEDDDKRKHFRWPVDIEASKAQANKNKEEKVPADKLWCGKGSGEFKGFTAKRSKFSKDGDTKYVADFHILSVDLGNRFAGAFSRLRIHADEAGGVRFISGEDFCPKIWADTIRTGTFRLRGEGADVWQMVTAKNCVHLEKQLKQNVGPTGSFIFAEEPYGSDGRGRYPDATETERFQKLADKLVRKAACSLAGTEKMTYPELGDHLVFRLKRHIGRLRTLFNLLWRVCGDKEKDRKGEYTKPRDDEKKLFHRQLVVETLARGAYPKRPRPEGETEDPNDKSLRTTLQPSLEEWDRLKNDGLLESKKGKDEDQRLAELQKRVANWNWNDLSGALKTQIKEHFEGDETTTKLLVSVVEFCLPLRGRHWKWDGNRKDRLFWGDNDSEWKPKIQGMRGLSLKRLEQVLNLRQRCQSFAKLEDRFVKQFAKNNWNPLPPMRRDEADDPCVLLLDKSNELRYQRVDQIAHLILAEALSVELKNPAEVVNKTIRKNEVDLHGEYKPRLGKNGEPLPRCSVIVLENLDRYRTSQERTRQENSRLMHWSHRKILEKLEDICGPFGITIMLVDPAFSSRFDSRNGLPGVRVNSVSKGFDKQMPYAAWMQRKDKNGKPTKLANDIVTVAKLFEDNPNYKDQLIIAVEGGKEFLSVCGTEKDKLNADINAAVNIGLRVVADPQRWDIFPRLRTKQIEDGEVQVLNWRGVFGRFSKDDEKRRLATSSALKAGSNVTTKIESAAASDKRQKKHRKSNQDGINAAGTSNDVESSTQSSEFPPMFVQAVDFPGLPSDKAYQTKSSEVSGIRAYPQGLFLNRVEWLCNERIREINIARLKK